jgi:hypothetical protein
LSIDDIPELDDIKTKVVKTVMVSSGTTKPTLPSEELHNKVAKTFQIGLEMAERTIKSTTQLALRHALHPIHRRLEQSLL